jgi:DNA-directed RNA polymerase subunit M/transcription elongation factor TFIIS
MATAMSESCPKCKGHLMLEKDHYGLYEQCLQCGYINDLQIVGRFDKQQAKAENEEEGVESADEIGPNIVPQTMHQLIETSLIESAPGGDK